MKNIIIAVLATTLVFVSLLAYHEWAQKIGVENAPAPQYSLTSASQEGFLDACRGDLEGSGYTVNQPEYGQYLPMEIATSSTPFKLQ
jgi:hypothetical protein